MTKAGNYCNVLFKDAREKLKLTHEAIAKDAGVTVGYIKAIEHLIQYPSDAVAQKISDKLGICADDLFPEMLKNICDDNYKNFALIKARESAKLTKYALAKKADVTPPTIDNYEYLKTYPRHDVAQRIADALNVDVNTIFPSLLKNIIYRVKEERLYGKCFELADTSLDDGLIRNLENNGKLSSDQPSPVQMATHTALREKLARVLHTLPYREREIVKMRFGIGSGYSYTLEEVGKVFKITRERVRKIEEKALRKLQHPTRIRKLESFMAGVKNL